MNKNINHPPDYSSAPQDNLILEHYGINELNFESIKNYRYKFSAIKPDHPWNGLETKEFLYKIGAWGKVRNTSKEGLTIAGLLMFSEERIITEVLPQYFLEYRESLEGTEKGNWSNRFTSQDGTWSGNVFDFYFKASADLAADYNVLYENNRFDQSVEKDDLSCLHEALINSLVHSDYYGGGGIVIEKEKELFRFSNPGLFRMSVEQALEGNMSNLRNPNLFKMFILIGLCKRTGSGLKNIEATWEKKKEGTLDIIQALESERTILALHVKLNLLEEEEQLKEVDESDLFIFHEDEEPLTKNVDDTIDSINKNESSINKEGNSYIKYKNSDIIIDNSINNKTNSDINNGNSYNIDDKSVSKENNSDNNREYLFIHTFNSDNSEVPIINHENTDITDITANDLTYEQKEKAADLSSSKEVEEELWEISELARRKRRLQPSTMEEIIIRLCTQKPLMLKELAYLLERTPDGLRNNYLAKLLSKGRVRLKYPDQLNHPKQAYMVVEKKDQ
ncbi:ATP-binding protein [Domibacillus aminovorans]|uniref:Transcriptional regulator n=1 Tax=Domibacillus aminovorans TaxID=29332 RepID=A0A177KZK2_9BACI|nr:ATP-binding protein [Domibacillus aminovorans]OAH58773.1 transcriptional regulator [Domibacillus aminovorans]